MYELEYLDIKEEKQYEDIINKVIQKCFEEENLINSQLYISITLTNAENIKNINEKYRHINKETDVLSFPMFEIEELSEMLRNNQFMHRDVLGDIVISIEKVKEQSEEYGHGFERELAYMIVHGFYHLMGYDHIKEKDKTLMRAKEENILEKLKIKRG